MSEPCECKAERYKTKSTGNLIIDNLNGFVCVFYHPHDNGNDEPIWSGNIEYFCTEEGRAEAIVACQEKGFTVPEHWRTERYLSCHPVSECEILQEYNG